MSHLNLQDQLITNLILALSNRRCSPTYSTSYHWNERILLLSHSLLETPNASLCTLLHRITRNAQWFQTQYRTELSKLQQAQTEVAVAKRRDLVADFEGDRGAKHVFAPMMQAQAERQEVELRAVLPLRVGPETPLRSHPVTEVEQPSRELEFRLTPPEDLVLQLEVELEIQEKIRAGRGAVVKGVDEDMLLKFWAANPGI
jgi:hypothetical protein